MLLCAFFSKHQLALSLAVVKMFHVTALPHNPYHDILIELGAP